MGKLRTVKTYTLTIVVMTNHLAVTHICIRLQCKCQLTFGLGLQKVWFLHKIAFDLEMCPSDFSDQRSNIDSTGSFLESHCMAAAYCAHTEELVTLVRRESLEHSSWDNLGKMGPEC